MYGNTSAGVVVGGVLLSGSFYMCPTVECIVIHHGVIKSLGGWKAVAFATRTLGRLGHSTSNQG